MKNIHVIPTDKPRFDKYLVLNKESKLCIWDTETMGSQRTRIPQNIYITSDEEIKEGDWYLIEFNGLKITQCTSTEELISIEGRNDCKKIILTTDPDLIKDGVQAIDDEFLEWFVKNPSCEWVEVKSEILYEHKDTYRPYPSECKNLTKTKVKYYLSIIPKEEHKQDYSGVHFRHCYQGEYEDVCKYGEDDCPAKPKEELKQEFNIIDEWLEKNGTSEIKKQVEQEAKELCEQETLEEGLLQHIKFCLECKNESQAIRLIEKYGFEKQEQDKNKFNEEDLEDAYMEGGDCDTQYKTFQEWFEQFKNK